MVLHNNILSYNLAWSGVEHLNTEISFYLCQIRKPIALRFDDKNQFLLYVRTKMTITHELTGNKSADRR